MLGSGLLVRLGRRAPHHHRAGALVLVHEAADVLDELVRELALRAALDVRAFQPLHHVLVEHRRHGPNLRKRRLQLREMLGREHLCLHRRRVGVVRNRVPAAEHQILQAGERDQVLDHRPALLAALAEADVRHLGQRSDGLAQSRLDGLDAGDECRGHGAHARQEDRELAVRRGHLRLELIHPLHLRSRAAPGGAVRRTIRARREGVKGFLARL